MNPDEKLSRPYKRNKTSNIVQSNDVWHRKEQCNQPSLKRKRVIKSSCELGDHCTDATQELTKKIEQLETLVLKLQFPMNRFEKHQTEQTDPTMNKISWPSGDPPSYIM